MFTVWIEDEAGWFIHSTWNTEEEAQNIIDQNDPDEVYCYIDYPDGHPSSY